jgi:hypothetical protein
MAVQSPGTDPLYAWDVPGWTNQKGGSLATAGTNLIESQGTTGTAPLGGAGGFLAQTMPGEAAGTTVTADTTNTFFGYLIYVNEAVSTTGIAFANVAAGTCTVFYGALASIISQTSLSTVAATAESHASLANTTTLDLAWSGGPFLIAPGYYYLGYAMTQSVAVTMLGSPVAAGYTPSSGAALLSSPNAPWFRTVTGSVTISSAFPAAVTSAKSSNSLPWLALY